MIKLKRAYEKPARDDGERILVERLWPRGLTKLEAERRSVAEGRCAERGIKAVVRARSG